VDRRKAARNFAKHDVSFDEASTVFADGLSLTILDPDHSEDEERSIIIGQSNRGRLLVVIHSESENSVRIISARRAESASGRGMKRHDRNGDEMRSYYDFSAGVRGKYTKRYAEGTNIVVLDPDVTNVFKDAESVNETLRAVARIIDLQAHKGRTAGRTSRSRRRPKAGRA
jgi:uncharacterized protein